jgi:ABC-type uncharacterized transport system permease subunit
VIHAFLLPLGLLLLVWGIYLVVRRRQGAAIGGALTRLVIGVLVLVWFAVTSTVPAEFTNMTPYITTLLVLAFAAQRLRMPAADGQVYRKGEAR